MSTKRQRGEPVITYKHEMNKPFETFNSGEQAAREFTSRTGKYYHSVQFNDIPRDHNGAVPDGNLLKEELGIISVTRRDK